MRDENRKITAVPSAARATDVGVRFFVLVCCLLAVSACAAKRPPAAGLHGTAYGGLKASQRPYTVMGRRYQPLPTHRGFVQTGIASWYGRDFDGKKTSNGERYDMHAMTAAHKTLPLGVFVKVTNRANGREAIVRINDRGPFVKGRIIDLSYAAARKLGVDAPGTAPVRIEALGYRTDGGGFTDGNYDSGSYTVQIGSFREYGNALRLSGEMKKRFGFSEIRRTNLSGNDFYRVYAGHYSSLKAAQNAEEEFDGGGYPGSFTVSLD
jgi:peptidoglycan lytic transglycosylase